VDCFFDSFYDRDFFIDGKGKYVDWNLSGGGGNFWMAVDIVS
jgi:hypothetical protein